MENPEITQKNKDWIKKYKVIHVTDEDIAKGDAGSIETCAIARALERTFYKDGCYEARVHASDGSVLFEDEVFVNTCNASVNLNWDDKIESWIERFDSNDDAKKCKPFDIKMKWSKIFPFEIRCKMVNG